MKKLLVGFLGVAMLIGAACSDDETNGPCTVDTLAFGADCSCADQCGDINGMAATCYEFNNGAKCTLACPADPSECPNNGGGCNNKSPAVCKIN